MGRTELTPEERDKRLNIILDAARNIFLQKGFFKTTMEDIANESGLSRRTIYIYFKNKDEITYEIVVRAFSSIKTMVQEASASSKSGYDKLMDIRDGYIRYHKDNFADLTFTNFLDFKINTQLIEETQTKSCLYHINSIVETIDRCIAEGIKDGSVRDTIKDTRRTALTAINIIHATMQKLAIRNGVLDFTANYNSTELIDEMFEIFFQSLRP